jgi:hypothetical protein
VQPQHLGTGLGVWHERADDWILGRPEYQYLAVGRTPAPLAVAPPGRLSDLVQPSLSSQDKRDKIDVHASLDQ